MEFTPNFNSNAGGFLIDPNARELAGSSPSRIGDNGSRNTRLLRSARAPARGTTTPSSWTPRAAAATQIIPYVDGKPVDLHEARRGTGAGNFANSDAQLHVARRDLACSATAPSTRSRSTTAPSTPTTIANHFAGNPQAADGVVHGLRRSGDTSAQKVTFDATGSTARPRARSRSTSGTSTATALRDRHRHDPKTPPTSTAPRATVDVSCASPTAREGGDVHRLSRSSTGSPATPTRLATRRARRLLAHGRARRPTIADSMGTSPATTTGGPDLRRPRRRDRRNRHLGQIRRRQRRRHGPSTSRAPAS